MRPARPDRGVEAPDELLGDVREFAQHPQGPGRCPGAVPGALQGPRAEQMGQRVGDLEQIGARHQIFADALLQRDEEIAHAVELVLHVGRFAAERTAGVHDGERQIVADVRIDAREGELQRAYAWMAAVLEQRTPAGGRTVVGGAGSDGRQIASGEPNIQRGRGFRVGEPARRRCAGRPLP